MKKIYLLIIALCLIINLKAQVIKTVTVTSGTLSSVLTPEEITSITSLTLTGTINAWDIKVIGTMTSLTYLDISQTNITATFMEYANFPANWFPGMTIGRNSFNDRGISLPQLRTIKLPNTLQVIGCGAFYGCGLTSIIFPPSVTTIGWEAFCNCTSLESVIIPSTITHIDEWAFSFCTGLIAVEFEEGIKSVPRGAFAGCTSLTNIALPSTMELIQMDAFSQCPAVQIVSCKNPVPPVIERASSFDFDKSKCTLFIPYGSVSLYASADIWKEFTHVIELFGFELSYTELTIGPDPSVQTVDITYDGAWTAVSDKDWLTVSPASGESSQTVTITASGNTAPTARFATITFTTDKGSVQTILVKQHQSSNSIPIANAGADQVVNAGATVQLDGSASADPDHDVLTYLWTAPEGIVLSSATTAKPTFTAPSSDAKASYVFTLVVNDGKVNSEPDMVTIKVMKKAELSVSENTVILEAQENSSASVKLRTKLQWTVSCDREWLSVSPLSGENNEKLTFTAKANPYEDAREATVTITTSGGSCETITVTQAAAKHTKQGILANAEELIQVAPVITCYPNPFAAYLTIAITNPSLKEVTVDVYSISGQKIRTLLKAQKEARIDCTWDGRNESGQNMPGGIYLLKVNGQTQKVVKR